jgi:hypothetical protein
LGVCSLDRAQQKAQDHANAQVLPGDELARIRSKGEIPIVAEATSRDRGIGPFNGSPSSFLLIIARDVDKAELEPVSPAGLFQFTSWKRPDDALSGRWPPDHEGRMGRLIDGGREPLPGPAHFSDLEAYELQLGRLLSPASRRDRCYAAVVCRSIARRSVRSRHGPPSRLGRPYRDTPD